MKLKLHTHTILALVPAVIVGFSGCSSEPKGTSIGTFQTEQGQGHSSSAMAVRQGEPGGTVVQTYQETATVVTVDKVARTLTLQDRNGTKTTVKAGPEVANFDQIQVGDRVKATVTEELVVSLRKSGEASPAAQTTTVALAPIGAKPGMMLADTQEITAKVTAIDLLAHKATLQFPDGEFKTFRVRDDVDLSKQKLGQEVVIRSTQSIAISVQKP